MTASETPETPGAASEDQPGTAPRPPVDPDLLPGDPSAPSSTHVPGRHVSRSRRLDVLGLIAAGGLAGTIARYGVGLGWRSPPSGFPLATWTINISGALVIGVVMTILTTQTGRSKRIQPLVCTGFLGSWTTMSTFAMQSDLIARHSSIAVAAIYVVATVGVGLCATWAGVALGRRMAWR